MQIHGLIDVSAVIESDIAGEPDPDSLFDGRESVDFQDKPID